jgi:hypothetical protein
VWRVVRAGFERLSPVAATRRGVQTGVARVRNFGGALGDGGRRIAELEAAVVRSSETIEALTAQVSQLETMMQGLAAGRSRSLQLPFTERAQALKMVRDGRPARQIASALGVTQGEILLLTRVHEVQNSAALTPRAPRRETHDALALKALQQIVNGVGETA